jgi:HSP20 family protein
MTPSPFHGIFSAFNQEHGSAPLAGLPGNLHLEEEVLQESTDVDTSMPPQQAGQITVDIFELDNYYIIRAPIAGVRLADLDIEVDGKVITIRGERSVGDKIPEEQYYVQECFWGEFSRSITMPTAIDPKKIKATFSKDSILKILIPKEEKVKIVRINEST